MDHDHSDFELNDGSAGIDLPDDGTHFGDGEYFGNGRGATRKMTQPEQLRYTIDQAKRLNKSFEASFGKQADLPKRMKMSATHSKHITLAEGLLNPSKAAREYALDEIKRMYAHPDPTLSSLRPTATTQEVEQFFLKKLHTLTEEIHQVHNGANKAVLLDEAIKKGGGDQPLIPVTSSAPPLPKAENIVMEEAERGPGFFSRGFKKLFDWHEGLMAKQGEGGRLGFAVAELAVGGILTEAGGRLITQAATGLKEQSIEQFDDTKDGKNHRSVTLQMIAMTPRERIIKGVLGGAVGVAGVAGTIAGFHGLFRSM